MIRPMALAACVAFTAASIQAAAAVEVAETVATAAAPAKAWGMVGRFDAIATWLPGAESSPAVTERLTASTGQSYGYSVLKVHPKVLPVTDHTSTIGVAPSGGADDAAAAKATSGMYRAGLDHIKAMADQ